MPAISNYGELREELSDHVDHRNISRVVTRRVQMAESMLNRELRSRFQVASASLTFVAGVATLPSDFLEMAHVFGTNGYLYRSGPLSDSMRYGSEYSRYSIDGNSVYIKGYSGARAIRYFAALPTVTTSNLTTNWLLTRYPDVYLYAAGVELADYLKDDELMARDRARLADAMRSMKADDDRARWANTTVRVQGINP